MLADRFAANLRSARSAKGVTLAELAARAGTTASYISKLEHADRTPGLDIIERLAEALGLSPLHLLGTPDQSDDKSRDAA